MILIKRQVSVLRIKQHPFPPLSLKRNVLFSFYLFSLTLQAPSFDHFIRVLYIQLRMLHFFESPYVKLDSS